MSTDKEYPLYPELSAGAAEQAQALMDKFKKQMLELSESVLSDLYCNVSAYIESDQWINFRNELMAGFQDYGNSKIQAEYDFKKIRQAILKENREEIIADLNKDMVDEIEDLKKTISIMKSWRS